MKKKILKMLLIIIFIISIISIIFCSGNRIFVEEVDPELPEDVYYKRYFESCNMEGSCSNQVDEDEVIKLKEYYETYENRDYEIVLAYYYKDDGLFRKYFYYYNDMNNIEKTNYTDPDNNLLSYNEYEYDRNKNLIKKEQYLADGTLYKETKYIYEDFDKLKIINTLDYTPEEFVRRQYVVIEYDIEGEIVAQTDYDTYYLVFKPSIGTITKDMLMNYFLKNPRIIEQELIADNVDYTGYTILHVKNNTKDIAQKLLVSLNSVGEVRDTEDVKFTKNIITFIR